MKNILIRGNETTCLFMSTVQWYVCFNGTMSTMFFFEGGISLSWIIGFPNFFLIMDYIGFPLVVFYLIMCYVPTLLCLLSRALDNVHLGPKNM